MCLSKCESESIGAHMVGVTMGCVPTPYNLHSFAFTKNTYKRNTLLLNRIR